MNLPATPANTSAEPTKQYWGTCQSSEISLALYVQLCITWTMPCLGKHSIVSTSQIHLLSYTLWHFRKYSPFIPPQNREVLQNSRRQCCQKTETHSNSCDQHTNSVSSEHCKNVLKLRKESDTYLTHVLLLQLIKALILSFIEIFVLQQYLQMWVR